MVKKDSTMLVQKIPDFIEKRLLEEYREQCLCCRHDSDLLSKLTAVLFPLAIAALTLPYLRAGAPKLFAVVGGLMLMIFWFFLSLNYEHKFRIRWSRVHEIERVLGLDSHLRIDRERAKSILKAQRLRSWMFISYIVIALLVTCNIKVESTIRDVGPKIGYTLGAVDVWTTPNLCFFDEWTVKLVITLETLVCLIIAAVVVYIWVRICKRDGKHSNAESKA